MKFLNSNKYIFTITAYGLDNKAVSTVNGTLDVVGTQDIAQSTSKPYNNA